MRPTWAPLWSGIVYSSVWDEPDYVCKVFITMLALKDVDHIYKGNAYQLSKQSRKTEQEVLDALRILASPDTKRIEKQPFDGRRIEAHEEGWLILNGEKYRGLVRLEMKRARDRKAQADRRAREKAKKKAGYGPTVMHDAPVEQSSQNSHSSDVSVPLQPNLGTARIEE